MDTELSARLELDAPDNNLVFFCDSDVERSGWLIRVSVIDDAALPGNNRLAAYTDTSFFCFKLILIHMYVAIIRNKSIGVC